MEEEIKEIKKLQTLHTIAIAAIVINLTISNWATHVIWEVIDMLIDRIM